MARLAKPWWSYGIFRPLAGSVRRFPYLKRMFRMLLGISLNSPTPDLGKVDSCDVTKESNQVVVIDRYRFSNLIDTTRDSLEIGPLNRPLIYGPKVKYFDLMCKEDLQAKAALNGLNKDGVPTIHFYDSRGDLGVINETFENVISSHVIEHQPDLIEHLNQVSNLLRSPGSKYYLVIPDHRYCFDHFISPSNLSDMLDAHREKRNRPTLGKVFEHRALTAHNDPNLHWLGNHGEVSLDELKSKWLSSISEFENSEYVDVHCWQFTPGSFMHTIRVLRKLELIRLDIDAVWETEAGGIEFCATLIKT